MTDNDPGKRKLLDGPLGFVAAFLLVGVLYLVLELIFDGNLFG